MPDIQRIAHKAYLGMAEATELVLIKPRIVWAEKQLGHKFDFTVRKGSGQATNHRSTSRRNNFKITYGIDRIIDSLTSERAAMCLCYTELNERFAVGKPITPLMKLGHTVIHESAHWIQVVLGRRYEGSVHNSEFYEILKRAYSAGTDKLVAEEIMKQFTGDEEAQRILTTPYEIKRTKVFNLKIGQTVMLMLNPGNGREIKGVITKINKKTAHVETDQGKYKATLGLLRAA